MKEKLIPLVEQYKRMNSKLKQFQSIDYFVYYKTFVKKGKNL